MRRLLVLAPAVFAALLFLVVILAEAGSAEPGWSVSSLARALAGGCLVASVLGGLVPKRSDVRRHASITFAIFAVTALGQSRMLEAPNVVYRLGCALFAVVVIVSLRVPQRWMSEDAAQRPVRARGRGRAGALLLGLWAAAAAVLLFELPPASRAAENRVAKYFEGYMPAEQALTGFSRNLKLGSTRGMLQSSKVVLRTSGPPVDYLRGVVLDRYDALHEHWWSTLDRERMEMAADAPRDAETTTVRFARSAPIQGNEDVRWSLPRGACDLHTENGRVMVDPFGIAHPMGPNETEISFHSGRACNGAMTPRALPGPSAPGPFDRQIVAYLVKQLEPFATKWQGGAESERALLDNFTRALGTYGYSLDVERKPGLDAVIDLLYVHKEGHCELFATALALLGRRAGIPTRLVSGYRVTEENAITGAAVVRERNAHTWVEAYVDGRWDTWDPTPAVEMQARSGTTSWESLTEVFSYALDRVLAFFGSFGLFEVGVLAGVSAVVLLVVRYFTQRTRKTGAKEGLSTEKPLPAFEALAGALAGAGWARAASEPLERFAARVAESDATWAAEVSRELRAYAELRYGGVGEQGSVARNLEALANKVRHSFRGVSS